MAKPNLAKAMRKFKHSQRIKKRKKDYISPVELTMEPTSLDLEAQVEDHEELEYYRAMAVECALEHDMGGNSNLY